MLYQVGEDTAEVIGGGACFLDAVSRGTDFQQQRAGCVLGVEGCRA